MQVNITEKGSALGLAGNVAPAGGAGLPQVYNDEVLPHGVNGGADA